MIDEEHRGRDLKANSSVRALRRISLTSPDLSQKHNRYLALGTTPRCRTLHHRDGHPTPGVIEATPCNKDQGIATNLTKTSEKHSHGHRNLQKKLPGRN